MIFFPLRVIIVVCCAALSCTVAQATSSRQESSGRDREVDFQNEIWPLLESRCLSCHNDQDRQGSLSLESRDDAKAGGHTGNPLWGTGVDDSELISRIRSDDPNYRMPKDEPPLETAEIELLTRWVARGANWPSTLPRTKTVLSSPKEPPTVMIPQLRLLESNYLRLAGIPLAVLFLMAVLIERLKVRARRRHEAPSQNDRLATVNWYERIGVTQYICALLSIVLSGLLLHHWESITWAGNKIATLSNELDRVKQQHAPPKTDDRRPIPPRPRHPPRLGGVYFRGNDERNPKLFNNGFYRTAELDVWLSNASGTRLAWNNDVGSEPLYLSVQISRAPGATNELFTPRVLQTIYMSRQLPTEDLPELRDQPVPFQPLVEGEKWLAHYPLPGPNADPSDHRRGIVYIYKGELRDQRVIGKPHYGIQYDLTFDGERISRESEIWMGSLYHFGPRLLIPNDRQVPLDEWFDFRPIPVIEGTNTLDPELLGIPEHRNSGESRGNPADTVPGR